VFTPAGKEAGTIVGDPRGTLVAEVVKTSSDQYVGRVSLVRVFSGTLTGLMTWVVMPRVTRLFRRFLYGGR
jgi:elongation factor G